MHLQDEFWQNIIQSSLEECHGCVLLASETLGISNITFKNWCDKLGIDLKKNVASCDIEEKRAEIKRALLKYPSVHAAALSLGISRATLIRHMKKLGIKK